MIAAPMASAGRFSPRGPLGIGMPPFHPRESAKSHYANRQREAVGDWINRMNERSIYANGDPRET